MTGEFQEDAVTHIFSRESRTPLFGTGVESADAASVTDQRTWRAVGAGHGGAEGEAKPRERREITSRFEGGYLRNW